MADPLVAPDVVRFTVNQSMGGHVVANIIDMVVLHQTGGPDREADIANAAEALLNAWDDEILGLQSSTLQAESITYVDLDSATGSTGTFNQTDDHTWPQPGRADGERLPGNVAMLVHKETDSGRGSRAGRMFLAGLTEQNSVGNSLTSGFLTDAATNLSDFTEALTETGIGVVTQYFPTVVHTRNTGTPSNPVIEYVNNTQIRNFRMDPTPATQRRRLRG